MFNWSWGFLFFPTLLLPSTCFLLFVYKSLELSSFFWLPAVVSSRLPEGTQSFCDVTWRSWDRTEVWPGVRERKPGWTQFLEITLEITRDHCLCGSETVCRFICAAALCFVSFYSILYSFSFLHSGDYLKKSCLKTEYKSVAMERIAFNFESNPLNG